MTTIKRFNQFGIEPESTGLEGNKIKIERILNKEIKVHRFHIKTSKYGGKGNDMCLHLEISVDDDKRVVFSSSKTLQEQIQKVNPDDFPFLTTIERKNERFQFT